MARRAQRSLPQRLDGAFAVAVVALVAALAQLALPLLHASHEAEHLRDAARVIDTCGHDTSPPGARCDSSEPAPHHHDDHRHSDSGSCVVCAAILQARAGTTPTPEISIGTPAPTGELVAVVAAERPAVLAVPVRAARGPPPATGC
jgi:hypothetical protein